MLRQPDSAAPADGRIWLVTVGCGLVSQLHHTEVAMNILRLLNESDYIQVNNQFIKPDQHGASEEFADEDDIVLEAHVDGQDLVLTLGDLEDATPLADGGFWLEGVGYLRFLSRQSLH
jgi:hypothetical protein